MLTKGGIFQFILGFNNSQYKLNQWISNLLIQKYLREAKMLFLLKKVPISQASSTNIQNSGTSLPRKLEGRKPKREVSQTSNYWY